MASTLGLLAAALTFFSSAIAFSPDQCNKTSYGAPSKAACTTLLSTISKLGVGNTSYLFIPENFPTPDGLSNGTRKNFPQTWKTTGCNAALVPIEVTSTSVTYDTSSYQDLATAGGVVVQQCISNASRASGGWELAGDDQDLVLYLYATESEIDTMIKQQNNDSIAVTSEDEIENAELDDPAYSDFYGGDYDGSDYPDYNSTDYNSTDYNSTDYNSTDYDGSNYTDYNSTDYDPTGTNSTGTNSTGTDSSSSSTALPVAVLGPGTFDYMGCELDDPNSRTMSSLSWNGTNLTVERCAAYCSQYQYMGVENGSECYCGGDFNQNGIKSATIVLAGTPSNCTFPCNGNSSQACGSDNGWMNAYQNRMAATAGTPTA